MKAAANNVATFSVLAKDQYLHEVVSFSDKEITLITNKYPAAGPILSNLGSAVSYNYYDIDGITGSEFILGNTVDTKMKYSASAGNFINWEGSYPSMV